MSRNPNCTDCMLHESSKHVCIWGTGDGPGFLVGEAPGREEGRTGKPFMGQAGQLMRPILEELGIHDPYITNAAKCRPPSNRKPEPSEIKICKKYLLEEIQDRKPKAILLLGAIAMRSMLNRTGITEMNGQVVERDGQQYVCAFHPAYVLRDPSKESAFRMAVARYASVLNGSFSNEMPKWSPIDHEHFDEFISDWILADAISFDTEGAGEDEGDGLKWWKEGYEVTSISFSLRISSNSDEMEKNWALAMPGHAGAVLNEEMCRLLLEELVTMTAGKRMVAHNGKYDNLCLMRRFGVRFPLASDTMLASHLTDENSSHGLKILARQHCGAPDYDLSMREKKNTRNVPIHKLLGYNAGDSAWTRRLDPIFRKKMDDQERWLYEKVIMPAARAFEQIEENGLYVDLDYLAQSEVDEKRKMVDTIKKLNRIAKREVNWNAPAQVAEVLYKDLGLEPTIFTDKVNPDTGERDTPSTGEEALVDIKHPIGKLLEAYRGHKKFLSTYTGERQEDGTYAGGWRDYMDGPRLYLSTKLHGTVTGRYSSRLHQTPRDGTIRNAIIAPPGWKFGQLDLSQAELKTIAVVSRDPELLSCFKKGEDVHWRTLMEAVRAGGGEYIDLVMSTAKQITKRKLEFPDAMDLVHDYGRLDPDVAIALNGDWKEARKKAKGINFGFAFGQSANGFINYAKTKYGFEPTLQESTTFRDAYFNLYHALPAWHERQIKLAKADGFVRNLCGRKRRLPGIWSSDRSLVAECERQAINAPIQGFIGDYKAMILAELMETFPWERFRIVGEVHDSILFWFKDDSILEEIRQVADHPRLAKECGLNFPINFNVDIEVGRWGKGTKIKRKQHV